MGLIAVWEASQDVDLIAVWEASQEVGLITVWEAPLGAGPTPLWDPGLVGLDFVTTILFLPIVSPAITSPFRIIRPSPGTRS